MPEILRWLGTPSWTLSQQCTIFSETRKTSSVFAIYVLVAFVVILGSLHAPRTDGHKLEEHWKDTVQQKKVPAISPYEQRRLRGLHSSSWSFQKGSNQSRTRVKKRGQADKNILQLTNDNHTKVSWLHPKDEDLNSYKQGFNISTGNQHVEMRVVANSTRSLTSDYGIQKWQTVNTQPFRLLVSHTSLHSITRQPLNPIRKNATVLGSSLYDYMKNPENGDHEVSKKTQLEIHDFADKLAKSHDAETEDIFTPQIPVKELLLTKRKSTEHMATRASFWQSRDTRKASAPAFYPHSTKTSAPATNRKGVPLKENDRGNDNVPKSTFFRPTISSRKETGKSLHVFQRSLSPGPHFMEPGRNSFSSNDSNSVSPMQQTKLKISPKIDLETTIGNVSSNKPVIGLQTTGKSMLLPKTETLKDNSTEMLTRNSKNRNLDQVKIIDSLKSSWFLFSSKQPTKSRTFQSNYVTSTPAEVLLTLSTKLKHRKDLSSLVRATDKPFVSSVDNKGSPLSHVSLDMGLTTRIDNVSPSDKSILKENKSSNVGTSSPAPMTSSTQTERKKRKRKKGKNKRRQRTQKTNNKKLSSNLQGVSVDKDMSPNTDQRSTTKKEIDDTDTSFRSHYEQRLDKPGGSSAGINTSMTESKTSLQGAHGQQRRPTSATVDSDWLDKIDYSAGSTDDRLTRLTWPGKSQSKSTGTDRKEKLLDSNSKRHAAEDMRRLFKTGLPLEDHKDSPSEINRSPSVFQFISKRKKGNTRERKTKNSYFQETKFPNFDSSASSGRVPITKNSSRLHFAKIATVLKTTVKRSARPVGSVTQTPNKKKSALNSKRWKFQLRKQKYKTIGFHIPNRKTRIEDKTQSSANSDSVKQVPFHSKSHSLFDHDMDRRTNKKTQTKVGLTKQAVDSSSVLYPFVQANMHTLTLKTSSPLSENQPAYSKMVSATSSPSIRKFPSWQRSTQIELYKGKESHHATTAIYDQHISEISTSLPLAFDKKNPHEKKLEFFVTQAPNSVVNNTTQVSSHFSSRIIRGTDESKSSQTFSVTASSDRSHDATSKTGLYKERKPDSSNEKDLKKQLPLTFVLVHSQTTSTTLSSKEIISVPFTASPASSQRPAITSKSAQHVTTSKNQTYNSTHVQNASLIDRQSSLPTSPSTRKNSSDFFTLHEEYRKTNKMNSDGLAKEQSRSSIRQESDDTFRDTSSVSGFRTSTPFPAIWTFSTLRSKSNQQSSQKPNTNKLLPSMKSTFAESVVTTHNPNLVTSRLFVTTTKTNDPGNKTALFLDISHKEQQSFFHPTTSSPSSFLTSSTSKSTLPLLSTATSLKTQSSPTLPKAKLSSPSLSSSNDIQKIVTPSSVRRTPNTSISILQISSVSNSNQKSQHRSTTKPLTKLQQSTKNEHSKVPTSTMSSTNKIITSNKNTLKFANSTKKPFKANPTTSAKSTIKIFITTSARKSTKKSMPETTLSISTITIPDELISTTDSLKPKYDRTKSPPPPDSLDYEELLVKCKVKLNTDINGSDFINKIKNGLVNSYLEGRKLLKQRKSGSTNKRRKREAISYVLEQNIGTHAVHYDETEGIEAKLTRRPRRDKLVEIYFQMLEYGSVIATDTAIKVFSQLQITEISVNLKYPIFHQIEAIKHVMFRSQLKPSMTNWLMVTIAAPSIPVLCVICILLTSWYRNHIRLRRKAMAEISRGSHYAESLADVGLEIDMEKGEIVSRAGSTSVLWTDITAGDTLERMGMAGDFPNADCVSSRSNSWNARGDPRTSANPGGRGLRQSPVAKQCQRNGKYVKKKHSVSSFHFENNLEDECPPVYESFELTLNGSGQWPQTSTLQSRTTSGQHLIDQQRKDNSSTCQIYSNLDLIPSQKVRPTIHANIISHFLAELDIM